jgi:hypothetical protein
MFLCFNLDRFKFYSPNMGYYKKPLGSVGQETNLIDERINY